MILFIVSFFLSVSAVFAQGNVQDTSGMGGSHYRISLITCGPGEEIWETFGHACIRVIDSTKTGAERDKIYNYGFFESSEDNPLLKQVFTGWLVDFVDTITYEELMIEYRDKRRRLDEQEFLLTNEQKELVVNYLKKNLRSEYRYYNFDTFYDNCSTRIRDLFQLLFGKRFVAGEALAPDSRLTYREVTINKLCPQQQKYWFGFLLNLFYASRADRVMSNNDAMFLPVYLAKGFSTATIDGKVICAPITNIQPETIVWQQATDAPFYWLLLLSLVVVGATLYKGKPIVGKVMSNMFMMLTGAMGCLMLYMMLLDGEPAWKDNWHLLWAMPTHLFFPFMKSTFRRKYSLVAMVLIGVSLLLHILRVQYIPLFELTSVLFTLLWVLGLSYRNDSAH